MVSWQVTKLEASDLKGPAENGAYIHGLYLDGASWNRKEGKIIDTPPKVFFLEDITLSFYVLAYIFKKFVSISTGHTHVRTISWVYVYRDPFILCFEMFGCELAEIYIYSV